MSYEKDFNTTGIIKGIAFSLIFTFILLLIIAGACYFFTISDALLSVLVMAAVGLSIFISSAAVSKNIEKSGLLHGLAIAAGYFIIIVLTGIIVKKCFSPNMNMLTVLIASLASGALGGIIGVNN